MRCETFDWHRMSLRLSFATVKPFEEIVSFIANTAGVERLSAFRPTKFRPTKAVQERVELLLGKLKEGTIRPAERRELNLFVELDHVLSLAKAKAKSAA